MLNIRNRVFCLTTDWGKHNDFEKELKEYESLRKWEFEIRSALSSKCTNKQYSLQFRAITKRAASGIFRIYQTGKTVATGFKTRKEMKSKFKELFPNVKIMNVKQVCCTATAKINFKVNIKALVEKYGPKIVQYEPELFPANYWTDTKTKIKVLHFHTGSCVITGNAPLSKLRRVFWEFKCACQSVSKELPQPLYKSA